MKNTENEMQLIQTFGKYGAQHRKCGSLQDPAMAWVRDKPCGGSGGGGFMYRPKGNWKRATNMVVVVGKVAALEDLENAYERMVMSYQGCVNLMLWLLWIWDLARQVELILRWFRWKKWRMSLCIRHYKKEAGIWGQNRSKYFCKSTSWKEWKYQKIQVT
uniref:AlNc14C27G2642 protein n=1 Tax=Albugo laibachii Nc14 TaxID=890382 RepID=F0W710_9STRA|nr:AlNc14C27G2642 [Albugo laibachii Nc14]|eukprot:CCA16905.1 AlNc14C27G2642 [Albugo laibachii Nc14]